MNRPTVFLSYAKEDRQSAIRLRGALIRHGIKRVWFDEDALKGGDPWADTTLDAIDRSRYFIALLSSRSVKKTGFVQKEIRQAIERLERHPPGAAFLIPVRLDPCHPSHPRLTGIQWTDLFPKWRTGVTKLVQRIAPRGLQRNRVRAEPLQFDGLYVAETPDDQSFHAHYLRFYRDGLVISIPSNYSFATTAAEFTRDSPWVARGVYSRKGATIRFVMLTRDGVVINYQGLIGPGTLMLKKYSLATGRRDILEYKFHRFQLTDPGTPAQQSNKRIQPTVRRARRG